MSIQRNDERYDLIRGVRDKRYRYIRNYMPRIAIQHGDYLFKAQSAQAWESAFIEGQTNAIQSKFFKLKPVEELYDTENDPWEINNLAGDPAYTLVLQRMRKAQTGWMKEVRDVGLIPETEYGSFIGQGSMYDYMRSEACPFEELLEASNLAIFGGAKDLNTFIGYLRHDNSAIRYWGATGLLMLGEKARPAVSALKKAADDEAVAVATFAAEALYGLGEKENAIKTYLNILYDTTDHTMEDRTFVLNSIDAINDDSPEIIAAVKKLYREKGKGIEGMSIYNFNDLLISRYLLKKWDMAK